MKVKEINRTAIHAWSPAQHHPLYLAAGTSAQQLDASFSTTASLEIFELDLAEPTLDMKSCGIFSSSQRYHKLVWGPHGIDSQGLPSGVLVAGGENGNVILYDAAKIISGDTEVVIAQNDKHTGPVRALDVNSFQANLVASGGNESEIYIWDLNNFNSPMTPGPKTQPHEDISCVAWNRQVQHILASASPSGRASVWDLRKNDIIIKVSDYSNRMHCSGLAWHPEVATQLVMASEDDRMPVIQMWDLRFAASPLKILENHTRGVLAIAWSLADPELLLSCGKDNRILCWDPNTTEVLYELPTSSQWCFDIQWCPRNPAVLSVAAFDGHISIYSIMGGSSACLESQKQADQISTSFGNMDPFGMGQTLPPLQLPQSSALTTTVTPLKKPPKWIRRPVGATFAFGGKLVTLENGKSTSQQSAGHVVHVSQVVTETALLERSNQLQATMTTGGFVDFCQSKIDAAQNEFEKTVWSFLKVNFENDSRGKYLELLGYNKEELALKIAAALEEKDLKCNKPALEPLAKSQIDQDIIPAVDLAHKPLLEHDLQPKPGLDQNSHSESESALLTEPQSNVIPKFDLPLATEFDLKTTVNLKSEPEFDLSPPVDLQSVPSYGLTPIDPQPDCDRTSPVEFDLTPPVDLDSELQLDSDPEPDVALISGQVDSDVDSAVSEDIPLNKDGAEADMGPVPCSDDIPGPVIGAINLTVAQDVDGLITQALLTGNFEAAVDLCLHDNRLADSLILAIAGGPQLLEKTQKTYFKKTQNNITKLISAVVLKDWQEILKTCDLKNWKEALAAVMTYAQPEEFSSLCDLLGFRLETCEEQDLQAQACLCYICAGNVEKLVACWARMQDGNSPHSLQDLVEKVVVLRRAMEQTQGSGPSAVGTLLAEKMSQYAYLLASQGNLLTAIDFLPHNSDQSAVQQLRHRISRALGQQAVAQATPHQGQSSQAIAPPMQAYAAGHPFPVPQPAPAPEATPAPAHIAGQYYQQVRSASTITSWSNQTPTALPCVPPLVGPASEQAEPSPPMFAMQSPGSAPGSAHAAPGYMYSQQYPQTYGQIQHYHPAAGGPAIYQPSPVPAASVPLLPAISSASPLGYPAHYMQPAHPVAQAFPGPHQQSAVPSLHPHSASSNFSPAPLPSGGSFQHGGPGSPVSYLPPPPTLHTGTEPDPVPVPASQRTGGINPDATCFLEGPQNGWNDPPTLNQVTKKKKATENYTPPAPITAPIMAPLGDPQSQPLPLVQPQQMGPGQANSQAPYAGIQQQPRGPLPRTPAMPKMSMEGAPGAPIGDIIQPMQSIPAEKISKKPIPEEHLVLKTSFEGLIQKCLVAAHDPQTKRKLDDANKRLESLYDKLREQTLSPAIVGGLHNMARSIEARSYMESLAIHTHIVSNSNFSETSAFMPVLKVVLTQANKLGV